MTLARPSVTIVNWNVAWRGPESSAAKTIKSRVWDSDPDVICLTETHANFLDRRGHVIEAEADYGYPIRLGRRKVILWSKAPWNDHDCVGDPSLPSGRFVRGRTATPLGDVTVIGICVPWAGAHVTTGRENRRPWQDHLAYLSGLSHVLARFSSNVVVVGDYNQRIPRKAAPQSAYLALTKTLVGLETPTSGLVAPLQTQLIDHVSHSRDFNARSTRSISNIGRGGALLTDHVGVSVELERADVA